MFVLVTRLVVTPVPRLYMCYNTDVCSNARLRLAQSNAYSNSCCDHSKSYKGFLFAYAASPPYGHSEIAEKTEVAKGRLVIFLMSERQ